MDENIDKNDLYEIGSRELYDSIGFPVTKEELDLFERKVKLYLNKITYLLLNVYKLFQKKKIYLKLRGSLQCLSSSECRGWNPDENGCECGDRDYCFTDNIRYITNYGEYISKRGINNLSINEIKRLKCNLEDDDLLSLFGDVDGIHNFVDKKDAPNCILLKIAFDIR